MSKPVLHFAHANGFPSGSYDEIFRLLSDDFRVLHVDMFAHDPDYPIRIGWEEQADQLIDFLENNADGPVIGIGHSFGASITFLASVKRPELFNGIIMMEPIFFTGLLRWGIFIARILGFADRISPAGKTKNRRRTWPDAETAAAYFRSRPLFSGFDPQCLQDYIRHGLEADEKGFRLRFKVEQEIAIYRTRPLQFGRYKNKPQGMAGAVICGEQTDAVPISMARKFARHHDFDFQTVSGGHLFPMEQPEMTVDIIRRIAGRIAGLNR